MLSEIGRRMAVVCMLLLASAGTLSAQADCEAVYNKFLADRKGPDLAKYRSALATGKEYLEKCGSEAGQENIKDFVTKQSARLAETIKGLELVERFNTAGLADNREELVSVGRELLAANHPASLDIMLVIASIGYDKAAAKLPVDTSNDETIRMAKVVLDKLSSGAKSGEFGAFKYRYKTKDCPDGAANASGWMNFAIGYIMAARQKLVRESLSFYYKAAQAGCETKNFPEIYRVIAGSYLEEGKKIEDKLNAKLAANQNQETEETKSLEALVNGYLDRAVDAYARAYRAAAANSKISADAKDTYLKTLKDLYGLRFDGKMDGFDQFVQKTAEVPFLDPMSQVKPIPAATASVQTVKPD